MLAVPSCLVAAFLEALGCDLRSAILDAGYPPAWQLAQPIGKS
jgi:hypothetical protein